jgi:hypothetical protein
MKSIDDAQTIGLNALKDTLALISETDINEWKITRYEVSPDFSVLQSKQQVTFEDGSGNDFCLIAYIEKEREEN